MGEQASPPADDKNKQRTAAEIILDPVKRYQGLTPGLTVTGEINAETKARINADMDAALKEFLRANPNGEIKMATTARRRNIKSTATAVHTSSVAENLKKHPPAR